MFLLYFSASCYAILFVQQKQSSKVTENRRSRRSLQHMHFLAEILLRFEATGNFFLNIFKNNFSKLLQKERSVKFRITTWKQQLSVTENHSKVSSKDPLAHKSKVSQTSAAITFARLLYSRTQLLKHWKKTSQKPQMRLFGPECS